MIEWYGTRVAEQYGTEPPIDWCKAVDAADDTTVQRGLSLIKSRHIDHPPTLPQFEACMRPAESGANSGPREVDQLCAFVMKHFGARLTPRQIRESWTYSRDKGGELVAIVPADGTSPEIRISALEMRTGQQVLA
jgi:hypothetical protein